MVLNDLWCESHKMASQVPGSPPELIPLTHKLLLCGLASLSAPLLWKVCQDHALLSHSPLHQDGAVFTFMTWLVVTPSGQGSPE